MIPRTNPSSFPDVLSANAQARPTENALIIDGASMSWGDLDAAVRRVASGVSTSLCNANSRVALAVCEPFGLVTAFCGVLMAGHVAVLVPGRIDSNARLRIIQDSRSELVVTDEGETIDQSAVR